ncbi:hypothetical protein LDL59_01295 [Kaistella anthropi]|nr:hypothetical protein [Kaistella anthropi]
MAGVANFSLPVHSSKTNKPAATLYFLDSGDYTRNPKLGNYAWIKRDQIYGTLKKANGLKNLRGKLCRADVLPYPVAGIRGGGEGPGKSGRGK